MPDVARGRGGEALPVAAAAPPSVQPEHPAFADRVRESFGRQGAMRLVGAELTAIAPGYCAIALAPRPEISQQHGYVHAGIVAAIADTAGGYAGFTLFPADASVLTV